MANKDEDRGAWLEYVSEVTAALDLPDSADAIEPILDIAAEVARRKLRPMAPVTTYLIGLAVGRGDDLDETLATIDRLLPDAD